MASAASILTPLCNSSPTNSNAKPRISFLQENPNKPLSSLSTNKSLLSTFSLRVSVKKKATIYIQCSPKATSVLNSEYTEEPQTKVKFQKSQSLPGCSSSLSLLGTGYREKVFAIIGVKVYAAGLYVNPSIFSKLDAWRGRSAAEVESDSSLFDAIFQAPLEKSLHIVLVRDVDGKTFWDALDEAISPRITSPTPADESALLAFRGVFQGRPLNKGTSIFLTWPFTSKILVCVSSGGTPSSVDAIIESSNVASSLFDVFLGGNPVSPSLKASTCNGLASALK